MYYAIVDGSLPFNHTYKKKREMEFDEDLAKYVFYIQIAVEAHSNHQISIPQQSHLTVCENRAIANSVFAMTAFVVKFSR